MKEYIRKTAIVFLVVSLILSSINISVFKTFAEEIEDADKLITEVSEVTNQVAETPETKELKADAQGLNESDTNELDSIDSKSIISDDSSKGSTIVNTNDSNSSDEIESEIGEETNNSITAKANKVAKTAEVTEGDFTYYYTNAEEEKYSCSFTEINDVIKNATVDMIIELNKDIKMQSSIIFETPNKYILDLKNHILTVESGFQAIRITNADSNVTIKNGTIKGANANSGGVWYKRGAGIFCRYATLTIENMTITENIAAGYGGGVYVSDGNFTAINSVISNNSGTTSGGGLSITDSVVSIKNCEVSNNEQTASYATRVGGIYVYESTVTADGLKVISNGKNSKAECGGICITGMDSNVQLDNCLISGNYANSESSNNVAGGISIQNGNVTLNNTVIKDNIGYKCGGVGIWSSDTTLVMNSGAIYNNKANNTYKLTVFAHDIIVNRTKNVSLLAPVSMIDGTNSFDEYYWAHYNLSDTGEEKYKEIEGSINITSSDSKSYDIYNASNEKGRTVAELKNSTESGIKFTTINEAIKEANSGDTIKLVANGVIEESVVLSDEKNITIDLNDRKWNGNNVDTKALTIQEGANVNITGNGTISDIEHNGESLVLNSNVAINTVYLGTGKSVQAGEEFNTDKINFKLSLEDQGKLETQDVILIKATKNLSQEVIEKISIIDADPLVIVMVNEDGNIVAHKMNGIFVNGETGDDTNNGMNANSPVKTFAKAKEVYENMSQELKEKIDGIFVTGTITVTGNEEWSLPREVSLLRYKGFTKYLVKVTGELTLKDIVMDGQGDKVEAYSALIKVESNGTLNIEDGTKLTNNKHTKQNSYIEGGGAIYCYNDGHINMTGGEISGNTSWYGGGIELWGSKVSMDLNGGSISNNKAIMVSDDSAAGGGIAVMDGALLTINNGEISSNESMDSRGIGGGIMVGNDKMYTGVSGATLVMNGGKISSNNANGFGGSGGGIYIQCLSTATINSGEITNNSCGYDVLISGVSGEYGGGGIYVNGGKGYEDGKLYIPSAYISNNTAKRNEGAGIAGCGTSTIYIYPEKATIYENNGTSQIYVDSTLKTGYGNSSKVFISQFAMGGGINNWNDINREITPDDLVNMLPETRLVIDNSNAENLDITGELASVKITGNYSNTRGGGIGSNGYVQIGETILEEIQGSKTWDDCDNQDGIRPESITVNLYANEELKESKVITEDDEWKWSFTNLDKYDGDIKIKYTITENEVEGYTSEVNGYDITNTHKIEKVEVKGSKTWEDAENQDGVRPESITINLFADGTKVESKTITKEDEWKWSFENLDKFANGKEIEYTITEDKVEGYTSEVKGYDVTNTHITEKVEVKGSKTWEDAENQDGVRPESITINLFADGIKIESKTVTKEDEWKWSFENLDKFANGKEIEYTITENIVEGYTSEVNGYDVINTRTPGETGRTVQKIWNDKNNQDGIRPERINVQLYANGQEYGEPVELNAENGWKYTWTGLPEKNRGKSIRYSVEEIEEIPGYTTKYSIDTFIITNTHITEEVEVKGSKTWEDAENQDGIRPESITINLFADGTKIDSKTVTEQDGWKWNFGNLDKFANGKEIEYTITEGKVEGYTSEVKGYDVTNTHITEKVEVKGSKTWEDAENQDGVRPESITINLFADGTKLESKTITKEDEWKWSFKNLDKFANGKEIEYTITEDEIEGYTSEVNGYDVTNTHIVNGDIKEPEIPDEQPEKEQPQIPDENTNNEIKESEVSEKKIQYNVKTGDNIYISFMLLIVAVVIEIIMRKFKYNER